MNRVSATGIGHHGARSSGYSYDIERRESVKRPGQFASVFVRNGQYVGCPDMILPSVILDTALRQRILGLSPSTSKQRYYLEGVGLQWDSTALQTLIKDRITAMAIPLHTGHVTTPSSPAYARPVSNRHTEATHRSTTDTRAAATPVSSNRAITLPQPARPAADRTNPLPDGVLIIDASIEPLPPKIPGTGNCGNYFPYSVRYATIEGRDYILFKSNSKEVFLRLPYHALSEKFHPEDVKTILYSVTGTDSNGRCVFISCPGLIAYLNHPIVLQSPTIPLLKSQDIQRVILRRTNDHLNILTPKPLRVIDATLVLNKSRQTRGKGPKNDQYAYVVSHVLIDAVDYVLFWGINSKSGDIVLKVPFSALKNVFNKGDYEAIVKALTYEDRAGRVFSKGTRSVPYLNHPIQLSTQTAEQLLQCAPANSVLATGNKRSPQYIFTPAPYSPMSIPDTPIASPTGTTGYDAIIAEGNVAAWREMSRQSHIDFMNAGNPRTRYYSSGDPMF